MVKGFSARTAYTFRDLLQMFYDSGVCCMMFLCDFWVRLDHTSNMKCKKNQYSGSKQLQYRLQYSISDDYRN